MHQVLNTKCESNEKGKGQYCYQAGDIFSIGLVFISIILKHEWVRCIPELGDFINSINKKFKNNQLLVLQFNNSIKRYFFENFVVIENAINTLTLAHPNFYEFTKDEFTTDEEYQHKINQIYTLGRNKY